MFGGGICNVKGLGLEHGLGVLEALVQLKGEVPLLLAEELPVIVQCLLQVSDLSLQCHV